MAKTNGLGVRLYAAGYDLSTDVSAISNMTMSQNLIDTTTLDKSAKSRIPGVADATLAVNGIFDNSTTSTHSAWTSNSGKLPTGEQVVTLTIGTALGAVAAGMGATQADYNVDRGAGGGIMTTASYETSDGYGLNYGVLLTAGPTQTDASATNSTAVDNTSSTAAGGVASLQVLSVATGSAIVKVQHSSDNVTFADLLTFTTASARTAEIVRDTGSTTVNRYVRVASTSTFTDLEFVVQFARL